MFREVLNAKEEYFKNPNLPVFAIQNFLSEESYKEMFEALQSIGIEHYDRYENPFEKKYTLKKEIFPKCVVDFLESFESDQFMKVLEDYYPGKKICVDSQHHYWGVHKFGRGDSLAVHADAGIHPIANKPKYLTIGFYLNKEWNESLKANLELWEGDSLREESPELIRCFQVIHTKGNTLVMFEDTEYAWHGASEPYQGDLDSNPRYFVTLSLLLDDDPMMHHNQRRRAYFAKVKGSVESPEMQELRKKRADNNQAGNVYRTNVNK
jgi:hypothetical protein